jgi:pimeloyl-ACP methyl ester carboxylesterase
MTPVSPPSPRTAAAAWKSGRATVAPGVELAYDEVGQGEPLLLIMGIGAQRIFWDDRLCERLAERGFRVIRFDHRDIGESSRLDHLPAPPPLPTLARRVANLPIAAPYTLSDMARDAIGLLDHLGIERAHVTGVSMGGMIAQHLAIEHAPRILSMTSIMSTPGSRRFFFLTRPAALRTLLTPIPREIEAAAEHVVRLFTVIGGPGFPPDADALRAIGRLAFTRGASPRGFMRHLAAICASGNRTRALGAVRIPSLVLHGAADPLIVAAAGRATARAIPDARLHIIPGMGHHMPPGTWDTIISALCANAARA